MLVLEQIYHFGLFGYFSNGAEFSTAVFLLLCAASVILCIAAGYFLGSINTSIIISKLFFSEDIRNYGSGNAGMTNVLRTYGKKSALLTLLGDVVKTVIAVLIGRFIGFPVIFFSSRGYIVSLGGYIAALFAVIGHTFPIYYRFKGGKGVLCVATAVCMLSPATFIALFVIFAIIVLGMKYVSLGSIVAVMAYPIILDRLNGHSVGTFIAFIIAVIVVYNHRENIKRLLEHKENRLSIGKKDKSKDEEK